jgi:hypothetical protein
VEAVARMLEGVWVQMCATCRRLSASLFSSFGWPGTLGCHCGIFFGWEVGYLSLGSMAASQGQFWMVVCVPAQQARVYLRRMDLCGTGIGSFAGTCQCCAQRVAVLLFVEHLWRSLGMACAPPVLLVGARGIIACLCDAGGRVLVRCADKGYTGSDRVEAWCCIQLSISSREGTLCPSWCTSLL